MEWGFFPYLAELLADRGFTVVRFNFSGTGMRPGDDLVTDLSAFSIASHSKDLDELNILLDNLGSGIAQGRIDQNKIGLFGHSRGGGTAILAAGQSESRDRLKSLVTWSAVSTFDRLTDDQKTSWRQQGTLPITNARTGQELSINPIVLDDLEGQSTRLDILAAASRCRAPWLIVHGEIDETVPVGEADQLAGKGSKIAHLTTIAGATHTFGATHPMKGPTPQLIEALNATQTWFRKTL
jgi:pimeloyl-ACP methyl ester carboxylesterase